MLTKLMWNNMFAVCGDSITGTQVADTIFVPSYSLNTKGTRLNTLGKKATESARAAITHLDSKALVLSHAAYNLWEKERTLKLTLLGQTSNAIEIKHIRVTDYSRLGINSYDEINTLRGIVNELRTKTLAIVAHKTHLPRVVLGIANSIPKILILPVPFDSRLERHYAIPRLKGFSTSKPVWRSWNFFFYLLTPMLTGDSKTRN